MSFMLKMVFKKGCLTATSCLVWVSCRLRSMKSVLRLPQKSRCEIRRATGRESALGRFGELILAMFPSQRIYT